MLDAAKIDFGQRSALMKPVVPVHLPCYERWQPSYCVSNREALSLRRRRRDQLDGTMAGGHQDKPLTILRDAVVGTVHDLVGHSEGERLEPGHERLENRLITKPWYVLHRHEIRRRLFDQAGKMV